jgi:hypothetical protein
MFISPKTAKITCLLSTGNNIRDIKACTFNKVQTSALGRKYRPTIINLNNNPITCDCDVFYLKRYMNYNLTLKCEKPSYYKNKTLENLSREDIDYRCHFEEMNKSCEKRGHLSTLSLTLIIVFATGAGLFCSISMCCYCKSSSQGDRIRKLKSDLAEQVEKSKPKKLYANLASLEAGVGKKSADTQALIEH